MARKDIGLKIITNGRADPRQMPWDKFLARVQEAAAKPVIRKPGAEKNITRQGDIECLWGSPIPDDKRCTFVGKRLGRRCKNWAMKGGTRCRAHGGYRELPEHPATVKRLSDIEHQHRKALAQKQLRSAPHKERQTVEQALQHEGLPLSPVTILQGIEALNADDNGKAWRRFIKHAKNAAPSKEHKARKKRLMSRPERPSRDTTKKKEQRQ